MVTMKCSNCGGLAKVYTTDYPCQYCLESGNCINEATDQSICTSYDVAKCECGLNELV